MGKQKKEAGSGQPSTAKGKKPSDLNYKLTMRWESNKKKRAIRHAKRMEAQKARITERFALGKPLHSKVERKLRFNASLGQ